jgi:hypothetical protein
MKTGQRAAPFESSSMLGLGIDAVVAGLAQR